MNDWPSLLERALRVAATAHQHQTRKSGSVPYITHPVAVAMLLQQHGFGDEQTLAAALLHDVVEDTAVTLDELAGKFPGPVVDLVRHLTERKRDEAGAARPWEDRKREHLDHIGDAPLAARAIAIADKMHNLRSMVCDLEAEEDLATRFNAGLDRIVWYYESMIDAAAGTDSRLNDLAAAARSALAEVRRRIGRGAGGADPAGAEPAAL